MEGVKENDICMNIAVWSALSPNMYGKRVGITETIHTAAKTQTSASIESESNFGVSVVEQFPPQQVDATPD